MGDILMQLSILGHEMKMVDSAVFGSALQKALADPANMDRMRPFVAYAGKSEGRPMGPDDLNVEHTVQILYRLGFLWPETGSEYVRRFIAELDRLGFFSD